LERNRNFEQALKDLEGFERIWVIYLFHLNDSWKPMVTPPRNKGKKVGVFASRSPHRPNGIGLSCVTLNRIEGLNIYISNSDILDGSPVLDIKPYLPWSDSFPDSKNRLGKNG
jgi:tRNA-Thr(GGU) m(6)t(6)A37 methyltransferase TsaA